MPVLFSFEIESLMVSSVALSLFNKNTMSDVSLLCLDDDMEADEDEDKESEENIKDK